MDMFCYIKLNMFLHIAHQISEGCVVIRVLVCLPETVRICIIWLLHTWHVVYNSFVLYYFFRIFILVHVMEA
jgi:hypothetical protein